MPLKGKYLKYSPEITPEIFTLIWDKLKLIFPNGTIYDWVEVWDFDTFKEKGYISIWGSGKYCFGINCCPGIGNHIETTVQEILGYDPFVKEGFVLPKKWFVKHNKIIGKWFDNKLSTYCYENSNFNYLYYPAHNDSHIFDTVLEDYIEITFEQFKKYVLKESIDTSKEVIPEYVECICNESSEFTVGKIYKTNNTSATGWYRFDKDDDGEQNGWDARNFKPSTKEAFNAQNKPKPIEKWSVGSYVVFLKDNLQNNSRKIGDISKIKNVRTNAIDFEDNMGNNIDGDFSVVTNLKWFATKFEAEEFAKTLVEPVKHGNGILDTVEQLQELTAFPSIGFCKTDRISLRIYLKNKFPNCTVKQWYSKYSIVAWNESSYWWCESKSNRPEYTFEQLEKFLDVLEAKQPLKQAVHCTTQEEWDFVQSKFNENGLYASQWNTYKEESCISLFKDDSRGGYTSRNHFKIDRIDIVSFQEWCQQGGYTMEKEVEFEVGKWYRYDDWYLKYLKHDDGLFIASEYISSDRIYSKGQSYFGSNDENKSLCSIEEIQQYLPEGHPDKIKSNDFKVGDWVYFKGGGNSITNESWKIGTVLKIKLVLKDSLVFNGCSNHIDGFRHATPEEIQLHAWKKYGNTILSNSSYGIGKTSSIEIGNKMHEEYFKNINHGSEVFIEQSIGRLDRSNKMILSINDEELPMVSIIKTNTIKQLLNND